MNNGFTLIEILLVFGTIAIVSSISFSFRPPKIKEENIIREISSFFYDAKINSIIRKEKTIIEIDNNKLKYYSDSINVEKVLKGIVLCNYTKFSYNKNGNIYKASTIDFIVNGIQYTFVFQVGTGTYEIR